MNLGGLLAIGCDMGNVVLLLPISPDQSMELGFTPQQARIIAKTILDKADEAERRPS